MITILFSLIFLFVQDPVVKNHTIDSDRICQHIEVLSSDKFLGRKPGTEGEIHTINYIADQFRSIGLEPANGGSFFQEVRLAEFTTLAPSSIHLNNKTENIILDHKKDYLIESTLASERISVEAQGIVFAGFGIHAPELNWNDYADLDVRNKIVIVLAGVPSDYTENDSLWQGDPAANIYSKSFYKKNEAASRGALGVFTVYKQNKQGLYNWESLIDYVGINKKSIKRDPLEKTQLQFSGLISREAFNKILSSTSYDFLSSKEAALEQSNSKIQLKLETSFNFSNTWTETLSHNVAAVLPGSDLKDEYMIYSAHWDHVGFLNGVSGDSIYNGAVDNASGTAALIELARTFKQTNSNRRSLLFLATTAEEMGLLGSVWYNKYPLFPLGKTAANFNMDSHYPYGKNSHITAVVYGRSQLDKYLESAAQLQKRTLVQNTEQNIAMDIFFRSDHFPFAEAGIPSEFAVGFGEAVGHDNQVYQQKLAAYQYKYHQLNDEYDPSFNCEGIADDAEFIYTAGILLDADGVFPMWADRQAFDKIRRSSRYESEFFVDKTNSYTNVLDTKGRTMDIKTADLDLDGDIDIVLAMEFSANKILINDGQGHFNDESQSRISTSAYDSEDIAIEDFDMDGDPDIFFASEDNLKNEFYMNKGDGYFINLSHRIPVFGKSNAVNSFDINKDGYKDLIIGNDGVNFCLLYDKNDIWIDASDRIPSTDAVTQDIEIGDIDQDGDLDILCANETENEIWINDGNGYFTDESAARMDHNSKLWETRELDLGDIDQDGDLDILLANVNFRRINDPQNRILINNGQGFFNLAPEGFLPEELSNSVDGDFLDLDLDGDLDIITANSFGSSHQCYENDGSGKFINASQRFIPPSVRSNGIDAEQADLNGDKKMDLILSRFGEHDIILIRK